MALIKVQTADGERTVRVCDYCKCVCIPSGRYCSGHCARNHAELIAKKIHPADGREDAAPRGA